MWPKGLHASGNSLSVGLVANLDSTVNAENGNEARVDMGERQKQECGLTFFYYLWKFKLRVSGEVNKAAVQQLTAFGFAGSSRCVDDCC